MLLSHSSLSILDLKKKTTKIHFSVADSWGVWSPCSEACDGGTQNRTMSCYTENCANPTKTESRPCNTHQCESKFFRTTFSFITFVN